MAKLNEDQVRTIKLMLACGSKQKEIASKFNVDPSTISHIARGKKWRHVEGALS
jgi:uncharacterized protein YjcR